MRNCFLLEKLADGTFIDPSPKNQLRDASHIRPGFRVFRLPCRRIEFVLTNGTNRNWEDNGGNNYVIDSVPGRYVIEHGIRRVGESDKNECAQILLRPEDRFIQVSFRADLWADCYLSYQKDGGAWTEPPGQLMTVSKREGGAKWFDISVPALTLACAFNDGGENWDSNLKNNYLMGCPGKYIVSDGTVTYVSPSDKDLERERAAKLSQPMTAVDDGKDATPVETVTGSVKAAAVSTAVQSSNVA